MGETMDTAVETTQPVSAQDDAAQEQAETNALQEFMADTEPEQEQPAGEQAGTQQAQTEEAPLPKGIRGRIQAAEHKADARGYDRGYKSAEEQYRAKIAEYEERLAKYADMEITLEAQELSRKEHISLDLAKRLIKAEKGVSAAKPEEPSVPTTAEPKLDNGLLRQQYENIRDVFGIDLLQENVMSEDDLNAVLSGKKDFNAVALTMLTRGKNGAAEAKPAKQEPPAPVRETGGRNQTAGYDFMSMSDEEFDRFNDKIGKGHSFKPR